MKKTGFIFLVMCICFGYSNSNAQSTTVFRRITGMVSTIPQPDTLAGKVWTDSAFSTYKVLKYIGTEPLQQIWKDYSIGKQGYSWIYLPSDSLVARVMSVEKTGVSDTFSITLDRSAPGIVNKPLKKIVCNVFAYSLYNDGDTTGTVNSVKVKKQTKLDFPFEWVQGTGIPYQEPLLINATLTDFLVIEKH